VCEKFFYLIQLQAREGEPQGIAPTRIVGCIAARHTQKKENNRNI